VAAAPALAGLTLVNAGTDAAIGALRPGAVLDVSDDRTYTVRADPAAGGPAVGSVVFKVDGRSSRPTTSPRSRSPARTAPTCCRG
jgi:hypothetical protein